MITHFRFLLSDLLPIAEIGLHGYALHAVSSFYDGNPLIDTTLRESLRVLRRVARSDARDALSF